MILIDKNMTKDMEAFSPLNLTLVLYVAFSEVALPFNNVLCE